MPPARFVLAISRISGPAGLLADFANNQRDENQPASREVSQRGNLPGCLLCALRAPSRKDGRACAAMNCAFAVLLNFQVVPRTHVPRCAFSFRPPTLGLPTARWPFVRWAGRTNNASDKRRVRCGADPAGSAPHLYSRGGGICVCSRRCRFPGLRVLLAALSRAVGLFRRLPGMGFKRLCRVSSKLSAPNRAKVACFFFAMRFAQHSGAQKPRS